MDDATKMNHEKKEDAAKMAILDDAFQDFHKRRWRIYKLNFVRGLFFGIGSVLGGTVLIAGLIWLLSLLVDLPGGIGNIVRFIVDQVQNR